MNSKLRLPAEWEKQSFIQVGLPRLSDCWYSEIPEVELTLLEVISRISETQSVLVLAADEKEKTRINNLLLNPSLKANFQNITFCNVKLNDIWSRDFGGISVLKENKIEVLDFKFNGWGLKFRADLDNQANSKLGNLGFLPIEKTFNTVLEGGSLDTDGKGTLLTTEKCLLSLNRNPEFNKEKTEEKLKEYLGIERVLWLKRGWLSGDDTDSHIDNLARFCDEKTIIYASCDNPGDEHFEELEAMKAELSGFRDINGNAYKFVPLPIPKAIYDEEIRLPASYINFLIINSAVLVPQYNDKEKDELACKVLGKCFPERKIIPIDCTSLIKGRGAIHCSTMNYYH